MKHINLSSLGHTWILDLDGTLLKHNGYLLDKKDSFLEGAKEFLKSIPKDDMIVFLTSRNKDMKRQTEEFLFENGVRYDHIIFEAPYGERILINDQKPSGLKTAVALNPERDRFLKMKIGVDDSL